MKLFLMILISLSLFSSNSFLITQVHEFDCQFRRVREHFFIQEVEKIFYEVAEEKGAPTVISPTYSQQIRLYAHLLEFFLPMRDSYSQGTLKKLIRESMERTIESETALLKSCISIEEFYARPDFPHSTVDSMLNQAYQILVEFRGQLSERGISIELPDYTDFIEAFFFIDIKAEEKIHREYTGAYAPRFHKILLNPEIFNKPLDDAISIVVHEAMHMLFPGFSNHFLDEGMTTLFTRDVTTTNNFNARSYEVEPTIVKQIQDIVGKEALLRAYATGSYEPLRGKLGDRIINIFKLIELAQMRKGYNGLDLLELIDYFIKANSQRILSDEEFGEFAYLTNITNRDQLTVMTWLAYKNKLADALTAIEEKLLNILSD